MLPYAEKRIFDKLPGNAYTRLNLKTLSLGD